MARKRPNDPLLISTEDRDEESPTTSSTPSAPGIDRARYMSLSQVATMLGKDRATVTKWVRSEGCPSVQEADKSLNIDWVLDLAEVVRWLQERAAAEAANKLSQAAGKISEAEAKRLSSVAKAVINTKEAAEEVRSVVRREYAADRVSQEYSDVRAVLAQLGSTVAGRVDPAVAIKVREVVDEQVSKALKKLKFDVELITGQPPEADDEEDED